MSEANYSLTSSDSGALQVPDLAYKPRLPEEWRPKIGLIGCGGITDSHLSAYMAGGLEVSVFCDIDPARAAAKRDAYFPAGEVTVDHREVLDRPEIEVVDIATHPKERLPLIRDAILAGKHVLSQKPFVLDLEDGEELVRLAEEKGVKLAVNQNGRWSPHWRWMSQAVEAGLVGDLLGAHYRVHWNHDWVAGTPFDKVAHVILYDFAIHWFDSLTMMMGDRSPLEVMATEVHAQGQKAKPPLLAQAVVRYQDAQASLVFDAFTQFGSRDSSFFSGTAGSLESIGPDLGRQQVTLTTAQGSGSPQLEGSWFNDGFLGTMGELLCSIAEGREPSNSARQNLRSLALCFAALKSARTGLPVAVGSARSVKAE